jgi:hypothetical protein
VVGLPGTIATTTSSMFHSLSAYVRLRFPPFTLTCGYSVLRFPRKIFKKMSPERNSPGGHCVQSLISPATVPCGFPAGNSVLKG